MPVVTVLLSCDSRSNSLLIDWFCLWVIWDICISFSGCFEVLRAFIVFICADLCERDVLLWPSRDL